MYTGIMSDHGHYSLAIKRALWKTSPEASGNIKAGVHTKPQHGRYLYEDFEFATNR